MSNHAIPISENQPARSVAPAGPDSGRARTATVRVVQHLAAGSAAALSVVLTAVGVAAALLVLVPRRVLASWDVWPSGR